MPADDLVAAELAPVRERSAAFLDPAPMDLYRAGCAIKSAEDVPRLLAAVEVAASFHVPEVIDGAEPFTCCRRCFGRPKWPCPEVTAVLAALKGESGG